METEKTIHDVIKERMKLPEEVKSFIKINVFLNIIKNNNSRLKLFIYKKF